MMYRTRFETTSSVTKLSFIISGALFAQSLNGFYIGGKLIAGSDTPDEFL